VNTNIENFDFQTISEKLTLHPGHNEYCYSLFFINKQGKHYKEPAGLIKEKIEPLPIKSISCSIWGYVMTTGIVLIISTWLFLAASICWFAGGQTSTFGHQSIQQEGFPKKEHSPIQIRPPPLAAWVLKVFYL